MSPLQLNLASLIQSELVQPLSLQELKRYNVIISLSSIPRQKNILKSIRDIHTQIPTKIQQQSAV